MRTAGKSNKYQKPERNVSKRPMKNNHSRNNPSKTDEEFRQISLHRLKKLK